MRRKTKELIEAARRNGALSRGPVTPEGKAASSQNARKHGLTATQPVFNPVEQAAFEQFTELFLERFQPADEFERFLAHEAARAAWLRRRADLLQVRLLDLELGTLAPTLAETLPDDADYTSLLTLALRSVTETSPTFAAIDHHARRLSRDFTRALATLQESCAPPPAKNRKNEPVCENLPQMQQDGEPQ